MRNIARPIHKRYALSSVDNDTYIKFVNGYSLAKKVGIRGVWIYISGSGVSELCKEAFKGFVRKWGRKKLASGIIGCFCYLGTPLVPLITNSTKVVQIANATHTCIAFIIETCEDITGLGWLPLDMALVGQPIPMGDAGRYNLMGGDSSTISDLLDK